MRIFWCCHGLRSVDETFLKESLEELSEILKKYLDIDLTVTKLNSPQISIVDEKIKAMQIEERCPFNGLIGKLKETEIKKNFPLLIYCKDDGCLAKAAIQENRQALWGYAYPSELSAIYRRGNKYIIWHEALHLFGADDCYDAQSPNNGTTCELSNCLMQYAPAKDNVGDWPFVCEGNILKLKESLAK